jgi:(R,R)-butanediol dehydrogenase/meso-butanediol dehydrogenase/diacetyl reductase
MKEDLIHPLVWTVKEVDVVPSIAHSFDEYDDAVRLIASGALDPSPIITRRVSFDEADEAFFGLLAGAADGKVLVTP